MYCTIKHGHMSEKSLCNRGHTTTMDVHNSKYLNLVTFEMCSANTYIDIDITIGLKAHIESNIYRIR